MMSPELAKRIAFGAVNAAKLIQIGDFIQGLEVFVFGSYQFLAVGKITMSIYCAWIAGKNVFTVKKPLLQLLIITLLVLIPSVGLSSYNKAFSLAVILGSYIILPFSVAILILASISIIIYKKRAGSADK
jgi:spore germination protein KB